MKKIKSYFAIFAIISLCSSCATINDTWNEYFGNSKQTANDESSKEEYADVKGLTSDERMKILEGYLDNLLACIEKDDFKNYFKAFVKEQKGNIKEDAFKERNKNFREQCGQYQSRQFISVLQKQLFHIYLWKARFSKLPEDDILLKMFVIEEDGKLKIYAFNIQPF